MSIVVLVEHDGAHVRPGSFSALAVARDFATQSGENVELLVLGSELDSVAAEAARFGPLIVADHPVLTNPTADRYAQIIADVAKAREASEHRRQLDDICERYSTPRGSAPRWGHGWGYNGLFLREWRIAIAPADVCRGGNGDSNFGWAAAGDHGTGLCLSFRRAARINRANAPCGVWTPRSCRIIASTSGSNRVPRRVLN